ncbi:MaoC family dehydratase [Salinisphaera sp. T31B1]|uniref:MaoC family dehydratase n=1 Tax=Salinisphaera sp. T31B1 TaxID=727963 RepID=UPI0033428A76
MAGARDPDFDPRHHRMTRQRWFEDFEIGERYILPSRTVTDAQFAAFQALSGDNHPIHYDAPFCRAHGHPDLLAHGLQVLCFTAAGAGRFPHEVSDSLIAFLDQSSRFAAPVYLGDTLYPTLTVAQRVPQRTTGVLTMASQIHNQHGVIVLEGQQRYLVRMRPVV